MHIKFLFLLTVLFSQSFSQKINSDINNFFISLINDDTELSGYLDPNELLQSKRLGIEYEDVRNKFMISFDLDKNLKKQIRENKLNYKLKEDKIDNQVSKILFEIPGMNYSREFYFKDNKLISPASYYVSTWKNFQTKYFDFFISDSTLFNDYSAEELEAFVSAMADLLQLSNEEKKLLEKEKIIYILCRDETEIKKLSGSETRGIYILAFDEIITAYNCHFHEIAHLLINFKLKKLPLYTLPFFQEGFAVAAGGRGGLARNILFGTGYFLQKSGIIKFNSIITKEDFFSEDASVTYPVAGLYSFFLIHEYGMNSYLKLYREYSGDEKYISGIKAESLRLPSPELFEKFADSLKSKALVSIDINIDEHKIISEGSSYSISETDDSYIILLRRNILITPQKQFKNYNSKKFAEIFPDAEYNGEKYLITAAAREINIYNLYTNILIASYTAGFTSGNKEVIAEKGFFKFMIKKEVFDEKPGSVSISAY